MNQSVNKSPVNLLATIYVQCRRTLGESPWGQVTAALDLSRPPETFPDGLSSLKDRFGLPGFIDDLARMEWAWHRLKETREPMAPDPNVFIVNPTLTLTSVDWKHLPAAILGEPETESAGPEPGPAQVITWRCPQTGADRIREADNVDLLALKLVVDRVAPRNAAEEGGVPVGTIHRALAQAAARGIVIAPRSRIERREFASQKASGDFSPFLRSDFFTLQWHITQACDLRCKHCYDRSDRTAMYREAALAVLEDFYRFCRQMRVQGQVTFTGGNPLLYPHFLEVYARAADRGFSLAILGNPAPTHRIRTLLDIAMPAYFQISLEGLAEHNDIIRGPGHFKRSIDFLARLRSLGVYTMVMLTLTRENMPQVIPLGRFLEDKADFFTFNRLSAVGEGAGLLMPKTDGFRGFLQAYAAAAENSPVMGFKDNLFNILRQEASAPLLGGCTGYGCGAAFNFVALLPDGQVHACRKFPSPIGDLSTSSLLEIYESETARRYRRGSDACRGCRIARVCRGCLAVTYSRGMDVFTDKDPFCFATNEIRG